MQMNPPLFNRSLNTLLLLTGFFFLLEISYFIQCNSAYFSIFIFVSNKLNIPITILPGMLFFIFAQCSLHLVYCFAIYLLVELIDQLFHFSSQAKLYFVIGAWVLALFTVFTANQFYFPNSKFSALTSLILFDRQIAKNGLVFLYGIWSIAGIFAIAGLIKSFCTHRKLFYCMGLLSLLLAISLIMQRSGTIGPVRDQITATHSVTSTERPNIILVGVDSLRPDFLGFFGSDQTTPFFDTFLQKATVFDEAVTPLARTFPSWSGILTGLYPKQTNIRTDLASQKDLALTHTLPKLLGSHGYETIYATDETRFSNIDKNFGFERTISPPMGLNDFLLGNFNDFPLSNLIINTSLGKWLFPYSYANRAVYFTYGPDSFLHLLDPVFNGARNKPLFLAVHFCLPHYPYLWANFDSQHLTMIERYAESIKRTDAQLQEFFRLLQQAHLLDHAIVVLLSDHGEALELPGDRITEKGSYIASHRNQTPPEFYPPNFDEEGLDQSAGHGTDVLGLPQYHALLAFKFYGTKIDQALQYQPREVKGVVSLLDIKPTILEILHITGTSSQSGQSLLPLIQGQGQVLSRAFAKGALLRDIFLESDFSPQAIRTIFPEERKVVLEDIDLFQIDPVTTRLTVKPDRMMQIIESKQYADIYGEWMLALYPQNKGMYVPILVNLRTGEWTNNLHLAFATHSPAKAMLQKLKRFYGNEILELIHNS